MPRKQRFSTLSGWAGELLAHLEGVGEFGLLAVVEGVGELAVSGAVLRGGLIAAPGG